MALFDRLKSISTRISGNADAKHVDQDEVAALAAAADQKIIEDLKIDIAADDAEPDAEPEAHQPEAEPEAQLKPADNVHPLPLRESNDAPAAAPPAAAAPAGAVAASAKNMWDLVNDLDEKKTARPTPAVAERVFTQPLPAGAEDRPVRRTGRVKTRLLGFEHSDSKTDAFEKAKSVAPAAANALFPVGWVVVVKGPGHGHSVALHTGVSQIGRGEEQSIQLDFGDTSISRENHAAIAYDDEQRTFFIGHGGKSNLVRLNGKPLLSTEPLRNGDLIRIGETTLRLVALCGEDFAWTGEVEGAISING